MIPLLLWRCPLCARNDSLVHRSRWPLRDAVDCLSCGAQWLARRVPGDNFYLKLTRGTGSSERFQRGEEHTLTFWYDQMKATLRLSPLNETTLQLEPGEQLYLASQEVRLLAESSDPLFFPLLDDNEVSHEALHAGSGGRVEIGCGRLYLTNRRLTWQQEGRDCHFPLQQIISVYAGGMSMGLAVLARLRLYLFAFAQESLLKWVTYFALVAQQFEAEGGRRIHTSHY